MKQREYRSTYSKMRSKEIGLQAAFENHDDQQEQQEGTYVKPTLIELDDVSDLKKRSLVLFCTLYVLNEMS